MALLFWQAGLASQQLPLKIFTIAVWKSDFLARGWELHFTVISWTSLLTKADSEQVAKRSQFLRLLPNLPVFTSDLSLLCVPTFVILWFPTATVTPTQVIIVYFNFFVVQVMTHWDRLSREDVESPSLEVIHNSPPPFAPHHLEFLAVRSRSLKCLNSEKEVRPWIKQITHWHIPYPKS